MKNTQLILPGTGSTLMVVPEEQLTQMVLNAIKQGIRESKEDELMEKLLSPKEVCNLFHPKISLVTLNAWTEKQYLTKYSIGGRTYYKYSEVMDALKTLKRYSRKQLINN